MTNLEYYTQTADHLTKTDDIRLYMTDGWLEDWYDSKHDDLLPWLLDTHKSKKYRLSKLERDLLVYLNTREYDDQRFNSWAILRWMKAEGNYKDVEGSEDIRDIFENSDLINND